VDAQPDTVDGEHGRDGVGQPHGEEVRIVRVAGACTQRLGEAGGDVHGWPFDVSRREAAATSLAR
jgi:hypothetical protein